MIKGSEPNGFGKNDDRNKKKKGKGGGNSKGGPKKRSNKSVAKGASSPSGNDAASERPKGKTKRNDAGGDGPSNKAKRPRRRNNKMNNKNGRNKHKSSDGKGGGNAKGASNYDSKTLRTNGGSIRTSDENNSLKGFKSENPRGVPPPKAEDRTEARDGADEGGVGGDDGDLRKRVVQLEMIVSKQLSEMQKLRREVEDLTRAAGVFSNVVDVLREAGLKIDENDEVVVDDETEDDDEGDVVGGKYKNPSTDRPLQQQSSIHDDMEIFGIAPRSVTDAADAAGASILSAILAGKHRMLVDVRDAELTRDPKLFVEFIELAILPVAAGLEGLDSLDSSEQRVRNRVKIVFPTVKELMSYRRSMALAAPEVVSLSTLGFDPVDDERDNLIVVIAPSPDDVAAVTAMEKLISRTRRSYVEPDRRITQPVVVLNHHMVPVDMAGFGKFTSVYHLRLLSVQYMTGDSMPDFVAGDPRRNSTADGGGRGARGPEGGGDEEDAALEAAMTHAHEIGVHQGVTRAMVIRAYPKPWHVFVDTSPDTDADFEVAATFDSEPAQEDVNYAIVECLEGSEKEDEIVAREMQAALEAGQLERVSDMLGISPEDIVVSDDGKGSAASSSNAEENGNGEENEDDPYRDWDDLYYDDWFSEDSV